MAGLRVGDIKALHLTDDAVAVVMVVDAKVKIRESSRAVCAWGGLIGNRYIDISLGDPKDPVLPPGSNIPVEPSIEIGQVLRKVDVAASEFGRVMKESNIGPNLTKLVENVLALSEDIRQQKGAMGKLIGSPELYDKAMGIADDLKGASRKLSKLIDANDERIGAIIEDLEKAAPEAREAFATIRRLGEKAETGKGILPALLNDEKMFNDLKGSLARLNATLGRIDKLTKSMQSGNGLIARLTNDEKLANDVSDAVNSLKEVATRLEKGDGTLARLMRDDDMYKDLKKVLDDARETLRTAKEQVPVGTFASVLLSAF